MMTVHLYRYRGDEHLGAWYPESDQIQVPRKGDVLYIETDKIRFERFKVMEVQWCFRDTAIGISRSRYISVEVHVRQVWEPLRSIRRLFWRVRRLATVDSQANKR